MAVDLVIVCNAERCRIDPWNTDAKVRRFVPHLRTGKSYSPLRHGGDGGVDDGDQAFTATALTADGTALAERVPSANFNMQKTGPIWRGDRKENL